VLPDIVVPPTPERRTGMRTDSMLESGLDLSEKPPLISAKTAHNTSSPFTEKLKSEPLLLPKEAMKLKKMTFPLIAQWGEGKGEKGGIGSSPTSVCEWMLDQVGGDENSEDAEESVIESDIHSAGSSRNDGMEESKVDEDSLSLMNQTKLKGKVEGRGEEGNDDDQTSFYNHELEKIQPIVKEVMDV